ncbi:MAG: AEC family transporter [Firmicutes bacterium]|jgi:predicted permease|nr:AEC family transporter [Bacillota bacterium]
MSNTFNIIFTVFSLIGFGVFLSKSKFIDEKIAKFIAALVVTYVVPATLITNMLNYFTLESLKSSLVGLLVPFLSIAIVYGLSFPIGKTLNLPKGKMGVFSSLFGFSNTVFVGLPVSIALFGNEAAPLALLFFAANAILFWGIAAPGVRRDAEPDASMSLIETIKKIFSPALITLIFSSLLILLRLNLPDFIMEPLRYIGSMSTPLALIYIGHILAGLKLEQLKIDLPLLFVLIGRFMISPFVTFLLLRAFKVEGLLARVSIIQAAMPCMAQAPIVAALYKADSQFAATAVSLSTLIGLLFLPLYMALFNMFSI